MIAFWVIGMPILSLILLFKNFNSSEDNKIKQYFLILYQGLKPKRFYWEYINTMRKILILVALLLPSSLKIALSS